MKKEYTISLIFIIIWAFWAFLVPSFILNLEATSFFQFGSRYLNLYINKIGGWSEYLSYFLLQLYKYSLVGALIQTLLLVLMFFSVHGIARKCGAKQNSTLLSSIAVLVLFALQHNPNLLFSDILMIVLTNTCVWLAISINRPIVRFVSLAILSPLFLALLGGTGTLVFYVCVSLFVYSREKGLKTLIWCVVWIALALGLPYLWQESVDLFNMGDIYLLHDDSKIAVLCCYGFSIFSIALGYLVSKVGALQRTDFFWKEMIAVVVLLFGAILYFPDRENEGYLTMQQAAIDDDWDRVLEIGDTIKVPNREETFFINLALARKGVLAEKLFYYNNTWGIGGVYLPHNYDYTTNIVNGEFYRMIDVPNEAIHLIYQSSVASHQGMDFRTLRRLIELNILKGDEAVAHKYLSILENTLCNKKWCSKQRENLLNPSENRRVLPSSEKDFFVGSRPFVLDMASMVDQGVTTSREYMLSYLLLDKKLGQFCNLLVATYKSTDKLPLAYQEAVLLALNADPNSIKINYKIDLDVQKRFQSYNEIVKKIKNIKGISSLQVQEMTKEYINSCWYYFNVVEPIKIDLRGTVIPEGYM
ncbi:MAG: DUF6057 family protein [Rikenellaceae bacterium]